jgi:V/A-type H+/Na+-transporting ATPase subunit D
MEQVSPTRSELLSRRAQIRLAELGAELLRGKREALVREFLAAIPKFVESREALRKRISTAKESLMRALASDGPEAVASAGFASQRSIAIETEERNLWGTRVVDVRSTYAPRGEGERGFTAAGTSMRIEETAERFETALELILAVAPLDRKLTRLAEEIRRTSRRVNALEQRMLPALAEQVHYIRGVLDQREREDILRLKHLKKRRS